VRIEHRRIHIREVFTIEYRVNIYVNIYIYGLYVFYAHIYIYIYITYSMRTPLSFIEYSYSMKIQYIYVKSSR